MKGIALASRLADVGGCSSGAVARGRMELPTLSAAAHMGNR